MWLVAQRLVEVAGGAMILVAVVFGSVLVGGWVWITLGLLGSWASSGTFAPPLVVGPAVVAACYLLAPVLRWAWSRRRPSDATPSPDGAQACAGLAVPARVQWMHPDRLAELTERAAGAQPCTDSTAPTSPAVSSDRSSSDVT